MSKFRAGYRKGMRTLVWNSWIMAVDGERAKELLASLA